MKMPRIFAVYPATARLTQAGYRNLFAFQKLAEIAYREGKDVVVKAPTGAGKTLIPLICITLTLGMQQRCVFIVPTRRLIDQTYDRLVDWFESLSHWQETYTIVRLAGEDRPPQEEIKQADIIVATYESFNGMLAKEYEHVFLSQVGLIIIDEMHYVSDVERGARLEDTIVKAKTWLKPRPQLMYLTAMLADAKKVAEWLDAELIGTNERQSTIFVNEPIEIHSEDERREIIARLVLKAFEIDVTPKETDKRCVLIFNKRRKDAKERAEWLVDEFAKKGIKITVSYSHAGLSDIERMKRMKAFQEGTINVLFTTTEYREGVDAPVLQVIIADTNVFSSQDIEQMIGRAARPKFYSVGYSDLIIEGNAQEVLQKKEIEIVENVARFKEKPLESQIKDVASLKEIILHRTARKAVSAKDLFTELQEFYCWFDDSFVVEKGYTVLRNTIRRSEVYSCPLDTEFISLLITDEEHAELVRPFVNGFLNYIRWQKNGKKKHKQSNTRKRSKKSKRKLYELDKQEFLKLLKAFRAELLIPFEEGLKQDIKDCLGVLIGAGFVEKINGRFRATNEGRWATQFMLPVSIAIKIHMFFQNKQFYSYEDVYGKLTDLIADCVQESSQKYNIRTYGKFIYALVMEGINIAEAAKQAKMEEGDAEGSRRTAGWIAGAVHAYYDTNDPDITSFTEEFSESLTLVKHKETRRKVRRYMKKKPKRHEGLQDAIYSIIKRRGLVTYNDIQDELSEIYADLIARTTIIRNVKQLAVEGLATFFSAGKGKGRPVKYVCTALEDVPSYMFKNCGACVFFLRCTQEIEKKWENQRYICELRIEYNKRVKHKKDTLDTYVTEKHMACEHFYSSRKRKIHVFSKFERSESGMALCRICKLEMPNEPKRYSHYTLCPNCNSMYYFRYDAKIIVEPGVRDLIQKIMEEKFGNSVKPAEKWENTKGLIKRKRLVISIKEDDCAKIDHRAEINQDVLTLVSQQGETPYLMDAIRYVRLLDGVELPTSITKKLCTKIYRPTLRNRPIRMPIKRFKDAAELETALKQALETLRETVKGVDLAHLIINGKKLTNAFIALQAEKDGLLNPADADRLFTKQMNIIAHIIMYWTDNIENLIGMEGQGERYAWKAIKLMVKDTSVPCGSCTHDRHVSEGRFMGDARARSTFQVGYNTISYQVTKYCQKLLYDSGFPWYPGELVLHHHETNRIHIGAILDFREMFLPLFRYVYAKACKEGDITANDFWVKLPLRFGEVYILKKSGRDKIKQLFDNALNTQVYYLDQDMTLEEAMVHCARLLREYLLDDEISFKPFICALNKEMYQEIDEEFQAIKRFCSPQLEEEDPEEKFEVKYSDIRKSVRLLR